MRYNASQIIRGEVSVHTSSQKDRKPQVQADTPGGTPARSNFVAISVGLLILAGSLAYANSFTVPFVLDDTTAISNNMHVRTLWPLSQSMTAPPDTTLSGRPIVSLSLALSFATSGLAVWDYHAFNLAIHLLAALTLFGLVRRTLLSPPLRDRWGPSAGPAALASAMLWMLHPLQTESVTYIVQRAESMMGLLLLLTLYCSMRAFSAARSRPAWIAGALAACATGMGVKEVMAVAPVAVLLYDRCFWAGTFRSALRRNRLLYAALACTWAIAAVLAAGAPRGASAGFDNPYVSASQYALSQFGVILHYLRLAVWPSGLVLDYGWPIANSVGSILPQAIVILALLGLTVWALWRHPPLGFLGAWFFLILAPTSSFVPLIDLAFEHRLYLPLASVVVLAVLAVAWLEQWLRPRLPPRRRWLAPLAAGVCLTALAATLATLTHLRNQDYRDELTIWADTVSKRPDNPRAHCNYGVFLGNRGQMQQARTHFTRAVELRPRYIDAWCNLGRILIDLGRPDDAIIAANCAMQLAPQYARAHFTMGLALASKGDAAGAIPYYRTATQNAPGMAMVYFEWGNALLALNQATPAVAQWQATLRVAPGFLSAMNNAAWVLSTWPEDSARNGPEAVRLAEQACQATEYRNSDMLATLSAAYAETGLFEQAVPIMRSAIRHADADISPPKAQLFREMLELFESGKPYRQARPAVP